MMIASGTATVTNLLLKILSRPRVGRIASWPALRMSRVWLPPVSCTLERIMFVLYSAIQLSMMPEMTSLTLQ